jgi:Domain of unknown function (DUF4386)
VTTYETPAAINQARANPRSINRSGDDTSTVQWLTGLAYLGLLITGALGFMLIRGKLYVADNAVKTAANLVEREGLARLGIALDIGAAFTQALEAMSFFLLFRRVHTIAAASITVFGLMNATALLFAAAFSATAL